MVSIVLVLLCESEASSKQRTCYKKKIFMKSILIIILTAISISSYGQHKKMPGRVNQNRTIRTNTTTPRPGIQTAGASSQDVQPRQTATDRYLNGPARNGKSGAASGSSGASGNANTFVSGVHAANNAAKTFDTTHRNTYSNSQTTSTNIVGGNDTTFNSNTISQGGVSTNSGAVDRSGQAQFGQTNWGNSRGTIGESQWTIPPPITASFNKEFPASNSATWTRNNVDTTIYSARYRSGAQWVTTNYNTSGQRLDMRTEFPLLQPPRAVSVYMAKQPNGFKVQSIYQLQVQGKPDVYEVLTKTGKTIYLNTDGMETNY